MMCDAGHIFCALRCLYRCALMYLMRNAIDFLNGIAAQLREQGREVEVTKTDEFFGQFVWLYSPAPNWYNRGITLSATLLTRTGRWSLGMMTIGPSMSSPPMRRRTRSAMRIAVEVYGR
jgi:hypothetical protein